MSKARLFICRSLSVIDTFTAKLRCETAGKWIFRLKEVPPAVSSDITLPLNYRNSPNPSFLATLKFIATLSDDALRHSIECG